uniref:C2H2-type domain-containing protein n=1 Tax=Trichogramma kaykai TaxID=54128 RepID=A0ABD2W1T8_9HYME
MIILIKKEFDYHNNCKFKKKSRMDSFGQKRSLNNHISTIHYCSKPFECGQCHKSYGRKGTLKFHIHSVHDRNKPFECQQQQQQQQQQQWRS